MSNIESARDSYYAAANFAYNQTKEDLIQLIQQTLDAMQEPVIIVDADTKVIFVNSCYTRMFGPALEKNGYPISGILNLKLTDMPNSEKSNRPIVDVLKGCEPLVNYLSSPASPASDVSTFSDIIPLKSADKIIGAIVFFKDSTLIAKLNSELSHYRKIAEDLRDELRAKETLPLPFRSIIGSSIEFVNVLHMASLAAKSNAAICLRGESGTGKEVLARAIHYSSGFANGPMIKVNCAAIPETLFESELFGYEKGAFTGAKSSGNPGKFELANGGTLFLDEIGELPLQMQVKLLRAIQDLEITRIGGTKPVKLNFRLITDTNKNLENLIAAGSFREDLYYRICVIPLDIPPLRYRRNDIPALANYFLEKGREIYGSKFSFTDEVMNMFCCYSWPGNIRELQNCIERLMVLCSDNIITADYLPIQIKECSSSINADLPVDYNLKDILDRTEKDTISAVLKIANGNKSKAISILGISKRNFYLKLEKYNLL